MTEDASPEQSAQKQAEAENALLKPVPIHEFIRFLSSVTAKATCQACGENVFTSLGDPAYPQAAGLFHTPIGYEMSPGRAATSFAVICANCGWLRFHGAVIVRRWLIDNPQTTPPADEENPVGDSK